MARHMLTKVSSDGCYYPKTETFRRIKRLSKRDPNLFVIGIPSYEGHISIETNGFLNAWMNQPQVGKLQMAGIIHQSGTTVPRMRDLIVHQARQLRTQDGRQIGRLLFMDSDIQPTLQDGIKLVSHGEPVVGALFPKKKYPFDWCFSPIPNMSRRSDGLLQCAETATGFKCYDLDVFDAMAEQYPDTAYEETLPEFRGQTVNMFFRDAIVDRHRLSEDYFVDKLWRDMGGIVYVDTNVQVDHIARIGVRNLRPKGNQV
jgi:hypothetical protein